MSFHHNVTTQPCGDVGFLDLWGGRLGEWHCEVYHGSTLQKPGPGFLQHGWGLWLRVRGSMVVYPSKNPLWSKSSAEIWSHVWFLLKKIAGLQYLYCCWPYRNLVAAGSFWFWETPGSPNEVWKDNSQVLELAEVIWKRLNGPDVSRQGRRCYWWTNGISVMVIMVIMVIMIVLVPRGMKKGSKYHPWKLTYTLEHWWLEDEHVLF